MLGNNKNVITAAPALKPESTHSPYIIIGGDVCIEGHLVSSGHVEILAKSKVIYRLIMAWFASCPAVK